MQLNASLIDVARTLYYQKGMKEVIKRKGGVEAVCAMCTLESLEGLKIVVLRE